MEPIAVGPMPSRYKPVDLQPVFESGIRTLLRAWIRYSEFFERVEVIIAIIWIVSILFKIFFLFYAAIQAYTQIFAYCKPIQTL